jgi:hypothetical protein
MLKSLYFINIMTARPIRYTISARGKNRFQPILPYLERYFSSIPREQIDSVFGFAEKCTLYGGRPATMRQLSEKDIQTLEEAGIGYRIPLTNHFFSAKEYDASKPFLEKYHKKGNSLIIVNNDLARMIRRDFPLYRMEASMIKDIKSQQMIDRALELFDTAVLPMDVNDDCKFLEKVKQKERITLFAVAGCAYTCPARTCYRHVSWLNKLLMSKNPLITITGFILFPFTIGCSRSKLKRALPGMVDFDVQRFIDMGYYSFKVMRPNPLLKTGH